MKKPSGKRGSGRGKQGAASGPGSSSRKGSSKLPGWLPASPPAGAARTGKPGKSAKGPRVDTHPTAPRFDPHAQREAQRYENPIASREMILQVLTAHDGPMSADELAHKLALTADDR